MIIPINEFQVSTESILQMLEDMSLGCRVYISDDEATDEDANFIDRVYSKVKIATLNMEHALQLFKTRNPELTAAGFLSEEE